MQKIGILGSGTWGTALARLLANKGEDVCVWSAIPEEISELSQKRMHKNLPGVALPESLNFTGNIAEACVDKDFVVFAVPSVYVRGTAQKAKPFINAEQTIVSVSKGIDAQILQTMTQVIADEIGNEGRIVAFSGPTHAEEVARDMPTMIVSSCEDETIAKSVQELLTTDFMRVYTNHDVTGVELCGAFKNVVAIAAGISEGLGFGDNAKAALITRGIAEISRLGKAMGCHYRTFWGLAGIGDLVVTATSRHSRNNRAGLYIGQGFSVDEAVKKVGMAVEGINAVNGAVALAEKYGVEMPIVDAVFQIVRHNADPKEMVENLMGRQKKQEFNF